MGHYSFFLFARPSFFEGTARVLDFGDTLSDYNRAENGDQADAIALWCDWTAVGQHLMKAIHMDDPRVKAVPKKK